jgi:hypothetical protein
LTSPTFAIRPSLQPTPLLCVIHQQAHARKDLQTSAWYSATFDNQQFSFLEKALIWRAGNNSFRDSSCILLIQARRFVGEEHQRRVSRSQAEARRGRQVSRPPEKGERRRRALTSPMFGDLAITTTHALLACSSPTSARTERPAKVSHHNDSKKISCQIRV